MSKRFIALVFIICFQSSLGWLNACGVSSGDMNQTETNSEQVDSDRHDCCPNGDEVQSLSDVQSECDCPAGVISLLSSFYSDSLISERRYQAYRFITPMSAVDQVRLLRPPIFV